MVTNRPILVKAIARQSIRTGHSLGPRRGAALVELAFILPVIVTLMMGSLEIGRAVMVRHVLEESARIGCRVGALENGNKQDVLDVVQSAMSAANIGNYTVTVDPDSPQNLDAFQAVTVSVSVLHSDITWLSSLGFMADETITGVCVMPAEGDGAFDPESGEDPTAKKNKKNKKDGGDDDDDDEEEFFESHSKSNQREQVVFVVVLPVRARL